MQFILQATGQSPDLAAIEQSIAALDPAVLLDIDAAGQAVRISTVVTEDELLACLQQAGVRNGPQHLSRVPSQCCGGCGG